MESLRGMTCRPRVSHSLNDVWTNYSKENAEGVGKRVEILERRTLGPNPQLKVCPARQRRTRREERKKSANIRPIESISYS